MVATAAKIAQAQVAGGRDGVAGNLRIGRVLLASTLPAAEGGGALAAIAEDGSTMQACLACIGTGPTVRA